MFCGLRQKTIEGFHHFARPRQTSLHVSCFILHLWGLPCHTVNCENIFKVRELEGIKVVLVIVGQKNTPQKSWIRFCE
jgi:hypothetical protein